LGDHHEWRVDYSFTEAGGLSHNSKLCRQPTGYGYTAARTDTTQQSGQTPDNQVEMKNITVYGSGYTETDPTEMLSPATFWRQQSEFVSSRQSDQIPAAVDVLLLQDL
jgi:hypothetical protein